MFRVLKPGGHLLAFSGSRTYHRMVVAIEDAGFEIRDQIMWLYGSGFPKSQNISLAMDKAAGAVGHRAKSFNMKGGGDRSDEFETNGREFLDPHDPITPDALKWQGWESALKPAHEPIVMARKPLIGTIVENVLTHGTGAINIDGCRVHGTDSQPRAYTGKRLKPGATLEKTGGSWKSDDETYEGITKAGRWPSNVIHDGSDEVVACFPSEAGARAPVTVRNADKFRNTYGAFVGNIDEAGSTFRGDKGSAARFFYAAKASKADRQAYRAYALSLQTGNPTRRYSARPVRRIRHHATGGKGGRI